MCGTGKIGGVLVGLAGIGAGLFLLGLGFGRLLWG